MSSSPSQLGDLLVDVREGLLAAHALPQRDVVAQVELEHLVKVLAGQLGLGVEGDVVAGVDGVALHALLRGDRVEVGDGAVPGNYARGRCLFKIVE